MSVADGEAVAVSVAVLVRVAVAVGVGVGVAVPVAVGVTTSSPTVIPYAKSSCCTGVLRLLASIVTVAAPAARDWAGR